MRRSTSGLLAALILLILAFPFVYPLARRAFRGAANPAPPVASRNLTEPSRAEPEKPELPATAEIAKPTWQHELIAHDFQDSASDNPPWWRDCSQWTERIEKQGVDAVIADLHQQDAHKESLLLLQAFEQSSHILRVYPQDAWFQVYCRTRTAAKETFDPISRPIPSTVGYLPRFVSFVQVDTPLRRTFQTDFGNQDLVVVPDGKRVITDGGNRILFWDLLTGQQTKSLSGRVTRVSLSPDGRLLAGGNTFPLRRTQVWDLASDKQISFSGSSTASGFALAFSPDSSKLISLGTETGIYRTYPELYDVSVKSAKRLTVDGETVVTEACFLGDNQRIVLGTLDGLTVFDTRTSSIIQKVNVGGEIRTITRSPTDNIIATAASGQRRIQFFNGETFESISSLDTPHGDVADIAYAASGKRLASIDVNGNVGIWSLNSGEFARLGQHGKIGNAVKFTPDEKWLLSAADDLRIKQWDPSRIDSVGTANWSAETTSVVRLSLEGRLLAVGGRDGIVRVWDAKTGEGIAAVHRNTESPNFHIRDFAFSPDSTAIAVVGAGKSIDILDLKSFTFRKVLGAPRADGFERFEQPSINHVLYSHDGDSLVTAEGGLTRMYDAQSGQLLREYSSDPSGRTSSKTQAIAISADDSLLASSHTREIRLWNLDSGELRRVIDVRGGSYGIDDLRIFDGGSLIAANVDRTLCIWNTETGELVKRFASGTTMDVDPHARRVTTGSADGIVRVWDIDSQTELDWISIGESILSVTTGHGGTVIVTDSIGTVHVLDPVIQSSPE